MKCEYLEKHERGRYLALRAQFDAPIIRVRVAFQRLLGLGGKLGVWACLSGRTGIPHWDGLARTSHSSDALLIRISPIRLIRDKKPHIVCIRYGDVTGLALGFGDCGIYQEVQTQW